MLGPAHIARKSWKAIRNAGNSALVAVASRDPERARRFIEECQADVPLMPRPAACGSYQELLARDDVDAVYIPLPTGVRKEWVLRAARAGKHVLCEKPCAVSGADLRAMLDACRENRVQFMDGVMFMHSGRLPLLRQTLDDGRSVGSVRRISSQFSFLASDDFLTTNIRASNVLEPLGCLGDLGWYNIRFSLWVMNEQLPQRIVGRLLAGHSPGAGPPVPMEFSGEMFFPGGASASFFCSYRTGNQQWANVSGTHGLLARTGFCRPVFRQRGELRGERAGPSGAELLRFQHGELPPSPRRSRVQQRQAQRAGDEHDPDLRPGRDVRSAPAAVGGTGPGDAAGTRRPPVLRPAGRQRRGGRRVTCSPQTMPPLTSRTAPVT
jgi:predicted dehydrogenase